MRFSISREFLIEAVEEGALVFDSSSGATTLISQNALSVIDKVRRIGEIDESDLATCGAMFADGSGSDLPDILASLQKIRLIFRC